VICFNGRLGWVPKLNKFRDTEFMKKLIKKEITLDYDMIQKKFFGLVVNIDFEFSNQTALTFAHGLFKLKSSEH